MGAREVVTIAAISYVKACTGLGNGNVIPGNIGGPRPTLPYVTVLLRQSADKIDAEPITYIEDDAPYEKMRTYNSYTMSVQAFGPGCVDILEKVRKGWSSMTRIAENEENNIQIQSVGGVQDLSAYLQTGFEDRALLEIVVGYADESVGEELVPLESITLDIEMVGRDPDEQIVEIE